MRFSFVLPVYNVAPYLRECLDSFIAQTVKGWEAICVDDGSTDGSGAILDAYAKKDCRIKVIHQVNSGVGAARNKALNTASGEWISFVDSDDVIHPKMLERMLEGVSKNKDVDIISFGNVQFDDGARPIWSDSNDSYMTMDLSAEISSRMVAICVCGALFKRSIMPEHGFLPYSIGEDLLFIVECLSKARVGVVCDSRAYGYRQRPGSAMHSGVTPKRMRDHIAYTRGMVEVLLRSGKKVDKGIYRCLGLKMTENTIQELMLLPDVERCDIWRLWYENLKWMRSVHVFPVWTEFVVFICGLIRLKCVAWCLCALPRHLKLMGIHR